MIYHVYYFSIELVGQNSMIELRESLGSVVMEFREAQ